MCQQPISHSGSNIAPKPRFKPAVSMKISASGGLELVMAKKGIVCICAGVVFCRKIHHMSRSFLNSAESLTCQ